MKRASSYMTMTMDMVAHALKLKGIKRPRRKLQARTMGHTAHYRAEIKNGYEYTYMRMSCLNGGTGWILTNKVKLGGIR